MGIGFWLIILLFIGILFAHKNNAENIKSILSTIAISGIIFWVVIACGSICFDDGFDEKSVTEETKSLKIFDTYEIEEASKVKINVVTLNDKKYFEYYVQEENNEYYMEYSPVDSTTFIESEYDVKVTKYYYTKYFYHAGPITRFMLGVDEEYTISITTPKLKKCVLTVPVGTKINDKIEKNKTNDLYESSSE